ncbi:hypothetical protein EV363DRAFT_1451315 [Boletus edulis]|nr:hypothetical protein EV363DRAFT_1451315 [Boletus edulis]
MAAPCLLYQLENPNYSFVPTEAWQNSRQTPAQATFTPNTNLRATLRGLTDVARDLPTEEALYLEIEKLCTATLTIDQAFYDIGRRLSDATKEQNKRTDLYDACYALESKWNEHHLTYQNLLWRSREFAGEAQATVDDFRELVLPSLRDRDMTRSEKQEIIREQIKVLQDTSQPSQNLCQEFLDFGRALDTYIAEFSRVVEGVAIGEQSKRVDWLGERLSSTRDAMEVLSQEMKELGWKFAADVAVTGIALLLAFVIPTTWEKIVDVAAIGIDYMNVKRSGIQFLEARRRYDLGVAEYEVVKAEYELEKACLGQMAKLESALQDSRPLVQEVTAKLGIFASVWAAITADVRKLKNSLQRVEDPMSPLFIIRVQRLEKMYGYLSQALRYYQVTVLLPQ